MDVVLLQHTGNGIDIIPPTVWHCVAWIIHCCIVSRTKQVNQPGFSIPNFQDLFFFPFHLAGHRLTAARWSRSGFTNMALLYFLTHVTTVKGRHHYSYLNSVLAVGRGESEGRAHNPRSRCSSVLTMLQQGRRGQWLTAPHLRLGMICVCVSAERDKSSQRPHD